MQILARSDSSQPSPPARKHPQEGSGDAQPEHLHMWILRRVLPVVVALGVAACGSSSATTGTRSPVATVTKTDTVSSSPSTSTSTSSTASATSTTDASSSSASGPAACLASGLTLSFIGQQGATGHGELGFALRNTGSASCSTVGYPGVQFLDRGGATLPTTPTHTTDDFFGHSPERALVVGPQQSVSFRLGVTHGAASTKGCTTAYGLQVIAPNDTATMRVQIPDGAYECATATVSPLRVGDTAYP
jgi:hypothetical protein